MLKQNNTENFVEALKEDTKEVPNFPFDLGDSVVYLNKFDDIDNSLISKQWNEAKIDINEWKNPRTLVQLGDIHLMKRNYQKAGKLYRNALTMDRTLLDIYEKLIMINLQLKKIDEANRIYEQMMLITDRRSDLLHNYVLFRLFFFKNKDNIIEESLNDIKGILKLEKNNHFVLNTAGFIYLNFKKDIKEAKKYFLSALRVNNKFAYSLNNLGVCCIRESKIEKAKKYLSLAIKYDNLYATAYENLAGIYLNQGNFKEALKTLENSLKNNINLSELWQHQIGWLLIQVNQIKRAIAWYEKKIEEEPDNNLLYNNLGYCYLRLNSIKKAKDNFRLSINIFRRQISRKGSVDLRGILAFYNMGRVHISKKNYTGAEEIAKELMSYIPGDAFARYLKGYVLIPKKDFSGAKSLFEEALKLNENIPDIYPNLAFIYESIDKDYESAIKCLEKSLSKRFVNDLTINNLSYAYLKSGQIKKAEKLLDLFQNQKKIPPVIFANKGLLNYLKGNGEQGDLYYKKAIKGLLDDNKTIARQHWYYEKAQYLLRNKNKSEAIKLLRKAKKLPYSYMTLDILNLENKIG